MRIWRIMHDDRVEAKSEEQAIESHMEHNSNVPFKTYTDKAEAYAEYNRIAADLDKPRALGHQLYWFDVVDIEELEVDEDGDIEDSYGADVVCGKFAEMEG